QPVGDEVPHWCPRPLPQRVAIQGRFSRLEPLDSAKHGGDLYQANSLDAEGRNWTYLPYGPFPTYDEYILWLTQSASTADPLYFAIIDQQTEKAVGVCSYLRIDPSHGSIEVGHLNFSPLLQGRPTATDAMYQMMKYAFELGYRRYEWKCHSMNGPSRRAAQRLGLSYEGTFRQAAVLKGRNRDTAWFAAIDSEWPDLQKAFLTWLDPINFDEQGRQKFSLTQLTSGILKTKDPLVPN
ncbi:GNAT family N-acetyltransferase, partial [Schlesneria sp.]